MSEWQPIESAPKDGSWLLLEGEMMGGDTSSIKIGRWEPRTYRIGSQDVEYEWRMLNESLAGIDEEAEAEWRWYSEGRVNGWMPLPEPPTE